MSMAMKKNPEMDFGFYMTIPRVVRCGEAYKDLSATQRWLYVCLKDLCGDTATCYRTLRTLAEETSISTGMLSESIRKLHERGLIHAEKKHRATGGKETWHITIVDIWQENGKAHPTKCSAGEQTAENVQQVNKNVRSVNKNGRERSAGEQECSVCETEVRTISNTITEVRTDKIAPAFAERNPSRAFSEEVEHALRVLSEHGYQIAENVIQRTEKPVLNEMISHQENAVSLPLPPEESVSAESSVQPVEMTEGQQQERSNVSGEKRSPSQQPLLEAAPAQSSERVPSGRKTRRRAEKPAEEHSKKHHPDVGKWYGMFNEVSRELGKKEGIPTNFTIPARKQYTEAFESLIEAGATLEGGKWLLTDIWKDPDPFWRDKRTPTAMASQYAARISRMPRHLRTEKPAASEISKPVVQSSETAPTEGQPPSRWTRILTPTEFYQLDLDVRKDYKIWERAQQKKVS